MRVKVVVFVSAAMVAQGCGSGSSGVEDDAGIDAAIPMDAGVDTSVPDDTGADAVTGDDAEVDAGPGDPCDLQDGEQTYHYVLRVIRIDRSIAFDSGGVTGGEAVGMDLDGVDGETCDHTDFSWEGQSGVDNNLAVFVDLLGAFVDYDTDAGMAEAIVEGDLLLLVRVDKWNGTPDDACVDVSALMGLVPAAVTDARAYLDMVGDDLVDPGVTLDIDAESFGDGMVAKSFFPAQVVEGGRILTTPGTIHMDIPVGGSQPLQVVLHEARLRVDITPTALSNGIVAGAGDADETADSFIATGLVPPEFHSIMRGILVSLADLWGDGTCDHISAGFYVEGVEMVPGVVR
jgi:hypothetical protein